MTRASRSTPAEALARAVALADLREATRGLGPWSRRRVRRLIERAGFELGLELPSDPAQAHVADRDAVGATVAVLQTGWLRLHGIVLPPSLGLREATHERYWSELGKRRAGARGAWWRRWLVPGGVAALVGLAVAIPLALAGEDEAPVLLHEGPFSSLPAEREATWVEALTDWVVALDRLARARHVGELPSRIEERERTLRLFRDDVLAEDLVPHLGEPVMEALGRMLETAEAASDGGRGWEEREGRFAEAVRATNRALFARGLGYFFDSYAVRYDDGRAEAALYTFRIAARRRYLADERPVDALHLRRLDRLNIVQSLLGYTSKRMDVAVLLVDKLEAEVVTRLGPALEPGREMPLHMDEEDEGKTTWLAVRQKAGQVVRESYYGALPGEQQALSELGRLLARRNDLVGDWNSRLEHRNFSLRDFDTLEVDATYRDRFEQLTSREARKVLDEIQLALETPEQRALFVRLVARHARPVELHEVQHRIDYAADDDFEVPAALLTVLQIDPESERAEHEEVRRVAYELSAYTAELARDPEWARVNLTLLCEHLYDGSGGAEGWSAVLILEGLTKELGLTFEPLVGHFGTGVDLESVGAMHLALLGQHGSAIARAAAALWERWFGKPLAPLLPLP